jgi:hypothetical protein
LRETFEYSVCIALFDDNGLPVYIAKLAQTLPECLEAGRHRGSGESTQESHPRNCRRLLGVDEERRDQGPYRGPGEE